MHEFYHLGDEMIDRKFNINPSSLWFIHNLAVVHFDKYQMSQLLFIVIAVIGLSYMQCISLFEIISLLTRTGFKEGGGSGLKIPIPVRPGADPKN